MIDSDLAQLYGVAVYAQIGFESFLSSLTDLDVAGSCSIKHGQIANNCSGGNYGTDVEVLFDLGTVYHITAARTIAGKWGDSTTRVLTCKAGSCDSAITSEWKPEQQQSKYYVNLELGFSYRQITGLQSSDPTYDLRGTIRETPGVTAYFTLERDTTDKNDQPSCFVKHVKPYLGVRSGLLQLSNVVLLDHGSAATLDTEFVGAGSTFEVGLVAGVAVKLASHLYVVAEWADQLRRFQSVLWTTGGMASEIIPTNFPTSLDFSGQTLSVGLQLGLKHSP
jgi:hypothetical protein